MSGRREHERRKQRSWIAAAAFMLATLAACGGGVQVRTVAAPEAALLGGRSTFRVVEAGRDSAGRLNGDDHYGVNDPMIRNSITSQMVHDEIKAAFEALGYRYSPDRADFEVAFTATVAPIMDIRTYGDGGYYYGGYGYWSGFHGYRGYPYDAWGCCGDSHAVASYDRSTVIIDAVDPGGKLLWRGQGTSDWYTDPKKFLKDLRRAVKAVANTFPRFNGALTLAVER